MQIDQSKAYHINLGIDRRTLPGKQGASKLGRATLKPFDLFFQKAVVEKDT